MSTKVTRSTHGYDLAESKSLSFANAIRRFQTGLTNSLVSSLHRDGFDGLTASQLNFLGLLDCGENYASALARDLGISRQAIHKTVRELSDAGWLETKNHPELGNQKIILFTPEGERMMSRARAHFLTLDRRLEASLGDNIGPIIEALNGVKF